MKKANWFYVLVGIFILLGFFYLTNPKIEQNGFEIEILAENLDTPWAIDFLPDGRMIFTERNGRVSILENEDIKVVAKINVSEVSESGLLGITVDPDFNKNNFVYVYYTHQNGNRVSKYVLNEKLEDEFILLDNIPNARFRNYKVPS